MENDHEITFRNELKVSRPIVEHSKEVDRKEVIKGLEYTKEMITFNPTTGEDIDPETLNEDNKITYDACVGAIAMLKEQEPRIITLEDFENNQKLDDSGHLNVWEEYRDGSRSGWNTINVNDVSCFSDIRRYWTDRPTDEQRKATPWGKEESAKGFLRPLTDARVFMAEAMKREDEEAEKRDEKKTDCKKMINELRFQLNSKEVKEHHDPVQLSVTDAKKILALLEMRMAKLLTPEEVLSPEFDGHVYVEILGVITPALVTWKTRETTQNWFNPPRKVTERFISTQQLEGNWLVEEDYGITWRCWNVKPSAEDCKNSPWDVQESNQVASEDPKAKKSEEKMLSDMLPYDVNISKNGEIIETHRIVGLGKAHEFGEKRIKELGDDAGYGVWLR